MNEDTIPRTEDERKSWAENMILKFPPLAASLGFSPEEATDVLSDCRMLVYVITAAQSAAAESKARTAYKKSILDGTSDNSNMLLPVNTSPAPPAVVVAPGVIGRLRQTLARAKAHPGFNESIGEQLQTSGKGASANVDTTGAKPTFKATATTGKVTLDWVKGKFDGVVVEGRRGAETNWTFLDKDMKSPFDDLRPNQTAGQPEVRRYRMIYLLNDEVVGTYSDIVEITTTA